MGLAHSPDYQRNGTEEYGHDEPQQIHNKRR